MPRKTSIQVSFTHNGTTRRLTLRSGGVAMKPTPPNIKFAERLIAEVRQKIALGIFDPAEYFPEEFGSSGGTVTALLNDWLKTQRLTPSTLAKYESAARFWNGAIGSKPTKLLKPTDIKTAMASRPELSGKTLNDYASVLRKALQSAIDDGVLPANPADKVEALPHQPPEPDPFTQAEAEQIIATIREADAAAGDFAEFRFFTGMRTGELIGLRWPNIDMRTKRAAVKESIVRGRQKNSTKTNQARSVDLNSRAMAVLMRQKPRTYLAGEHVFLNPRTGLAYQNEKQFNEQHWKPALKRLGIRYRQPYNSRHTYATMMLMAGLMPAYCASQLGHSIEVFLGTYSKWINSDRNAAEQAKLERAIGAIPGAIVEDSRGLQGTAS